MSVCIVEWFSISSPTSSKLTQSVPTVKSSYTGKGSDSVTQVGRFIQKYKLPCIIVMPSVMITYYIIFHHWKGCLTE